MKKMSMKKTNLQDYEYHDNIDFNGADQLR